MNMTIVVASKRSMEMLVACLCAFALLASSARPEDEAESVARKVGDESQELTGGEFSSIVEKFGAEVSGRMESEINQLIEEVEVKTAQRRENRPQVDLDKLRDANKLATSDIRTRIELVGDNGGALPQMSLGGMASSLLGQASSRLQSASSYVGNKLRALTGLVAPTLPPKIRRFFRWPSFLKYKVRFNKVYRSAREEIYRQMIFLRTHIVVGVQHVRFFLGRDKHLLGATQFADWTLDEYHERLNNRQAEASAEEADESALARLNDGYKAQLERLKAQGKNIFGVSLDESGAIKRRRAAPDEEVQAGGGEKRARRFRREASGQRDDELMDSEEEELDELNESEDEDELPANYEALATIEVDDTDEDDEDLDPEKLFEQFANVQLDALDDMSNTLNEALDERERNKYNPYGEDENEIPEEVDENFVPVDLRQTGCIIRPENQDQCGCCYAYALNAAAAYYNCMERFHEHERLPRYHPLYTAECGRYFSPPGVYPAINGCAGGRISAAYKFMQAVGVERYNDYNIARTSVAGAVPDGSCVYPRKEVLDQSFSPSAHEVPVLTRSRFASMKLNEIDLHLRTVGPVWVNIRTWKDFESMQAGIYGGFEEAQRPGVHSMMIVGHDKDCFNRDYWIIWNSYGVNWAERGFVRLYTRSLKHFVMYAAGIQPLDFAHIASNATRRN